MWKPTNRMPNSICGAAVLCGLLAACGGSPPEEAPPPEADQVKAALTIGPINSPRLTGPANASVGLGAGVRFSVLASGLGPLTYQWYQSTDNGATFVALNGQTGPTYQIASTNAGHDADQFRVRVRDRFGATAYGTATLSVVSGGWAQLGGRPMFTSSANLQPSLALCGEPHAAWVTRTAAGVDVLYVSRFDGYEWRQVGTGGVLNVTAGASAAEPSLDCVGSSPVVAWSEAAGSGRNIYVAAWNGTSWSRMQGWATRTELNVFAGSIAIRPRLRSHPIGNQVTVAWIENGQVKVKYWDSVTWQPYAGGFPSGNGATDLAFSFSDNGFEPLVAVARPHAGSTRVFAYVNRGGWRSIGNPQTINPVPSPPSLQVGRLFIAAGHSNQAIWPTPVIAWGEGDPTYTVQSRKFDPIEFGNLGLNGGTAWANFMPPFQGFKALAYDTKSSPTNCGGPTDFPSFYLVAATTSGFDVRRATCTSSFVPEWVRQYPAHNVPLEHASLRVRDTAPPIVVGVAFVNGVYQMSAWTYYP